MRLPPMLLAAIVRVCPDDEAEAERLAREWQRVLRETETAADRIRARVAASRCRCPIPDVYVYGQQERCVRCVGRVR